jgi:hypothetical protein
MLYILDLFVAGKIVLFGKKKHLQEEQIPLCDLSPECLRFDGNGTPYIADKNCQPLYTDIKVARAGILKLIKESSKMLPVN